MNFDTVFIVTYGRSGSTLLQGVINSIPHAKLMGENYNTLFGLYKAYESARRSRMEFGRNETDVTDPWFGADNINLVGFRTALRDAFVKNVLNSPPSAKLIGFKEIRYGHGAIPDSDFLPYMAFLAESFPASCFVVNTRNIDDVKTSAWNANDPNAEKYIKRADERLKQLIEVYPHRAIHMHFNEYIANPESFSRLFEFLGVEFCRAQIDKVLEKKYSSKTERSIDKTKDAEDPEETN